MKSLNRQDLEQLASMSFLYGKGHRDVHQTPIFCLGALTQQRARVLTVRLIVTTTQLTNILFYVKFWPQYTEPRLLD